MEGAEELQGMAQELLELSQVPGLRVESSPSAMRRLRNTYDGIVRASETTLADSSGSDSAAFLRARLADCIFSFDTLLTAIETTGYSSYDIVRVIAQLAPELLEIAQGMAEINSDQDTASDHNEVAARARSKRLRDQKGAEVPKTGLPSRTPAEPGRTVVGKKESPLRADEGKTIPFSEVKRRQLQKRKNLLVRQYKAANEQLRISLNAAEGEVIKDQISQLEAEIQAIDEQLRMLA